MVDDENPDGRILCKGTESLLAFAKRFFRALAPCDITEEDGEAVGRRIGAHVQPHLERCVVRLELDGRLLLNRPAVLVLEHGTDGLGEFVPYLAAEQLGA